MLIQIKFLFNLKFNNLIKKNSLDSNFVIEIFPVPLKSISLNNFYLNYLCSEVKANYKIIN